MDPFNFWSFVQKHKVRGLICIPVHVSILNYRNKLISYVVYFHLKEARWPVKI